LLRSLRKETDVWRKFGWIRCDRVAVGVARLNRIGPGFLLFLFFAILAGLAGVYVWKQNNQRPVAVAQVPAPKPKPRVFIVASSDLPNGRVIHESDFMSVTFSPSQISEKSKNWPRLLISDGRQIVNRRVKIPVLQGEPFGPESFYPEGTEPDLAEKLAPGMRAVTVSIPSAGFPTKATPGAFVDLLFRTTAEKSPDLPEVSRTLIERVQVLAIGDNATFGSIGTNKVEVQQNAVTLAVTPNDALLLKATTGHGEFSIALRGGEDQVNVVVSEDLKLSDIFEIPVPEPEPVPFVAEVFRRGQRQTITFAPIDNIPPIGVPNRRSSPRSAPSSTKSLPPRVDSQQDDKIDANSSDMQRNDSTQPSGKPDAQPSVTPDMDYRPPNPTPRSLPSLPNSVTPGSRVSLLESRP
jgi:Flp pilus assembly protein CpaB